MLCYRHWWVAAVGVARVAALVAAAEAGAQGTSSAPPQSEAPARIIVEVSSGPVTTFVPSRALGAGVDGKDEGEIVRIFTASNIAAMRSAGLASLTYRLRTELAIEAWHWNPRGAWSDAAHAQGYWTSSATPDSAIDVSYGYRLPRRGTSIDQGNEDGWSRLDDGDTMTFWKSNPYLDPRFSGVPDSRDPQWVVVDLEAVRPVNAIRLQWADPFATRYRVRWWDGIPAREIDERRGRWRTFPQGAVRSSRGGDTTLRLAGRPIRTRFVRLEFLESSHGALPGSRDVRDSLGYALRELSVGVLRRDGAFRDFVTHAPDGKDQSFIVVSSTDPWHRAVDRDPHIEQPGIDLVYRSGLTNGLAALLPVGVLYDTPANAAAFVRYVRARGYPVRGLELGEEPDGQAATPEHYASLYARTADSVRAADPSLVLGGPSLQTVETDFRLFPDPSPRGSWLARMLAELRRRGHAADFQFVSFEWYPFDNIAVATGPQLAVHRRVLGRAMARLDSVAPATVLPRLMTEFGYSAFSGTPEVTLPGALVDAQTAGEFLTRGGSAAYVFGYEPARPVCQLPCRTVGENAMLYDRGPGLVPVPLPTYWSARLLAREWVQPGDGVHRVYRVRVAEPGSRAHRRVSAYAVQRPDGAWALLVVNADSARAHTVRVEFDGPTAWPACRGPTTILQYSSAEFDWGPEPRPDRPPLRSEPPTRSELPAAARLQVTLPPYSLTVLRTPPSAR